MDLAETIDSIYNTTAPGCPIHHIVYYANKLTGHLIGLTDIVRQDRDTALHMHDVTEDVLQRFREALNALWKEIAVECGNYGDLFSVLQTRDVLGNLNRNDTLDVYYPNIFPSHDGGKFNVCWPDFFLSHYEQNNYVDYIPYHIYSLLEYADLLINIASNGFEKIARAAAGFIPTCTYLLTQADDLPGLPYRRALAASTLMSAIFADEYPDDNVFNQIARSYAITMMLGFGLMAADEKEIRQLHKLLLECAVALSDKKDMQKAEDLFTYCKLYILAHLLTWSKKRERDLSYKESRTVFERILKAALPKKHLAEVKQILKYMDDTNPSSSTYTSEKLKLHLDKRLDSLYSCIPPEVTADGVPSSDVERLEKVIRKRTNSRNV